VTEGAFARLSPAEGTRSQPRLGRATVLAGAGVLAAFNALANQIIRAFAHTSMIGNVSNLAGISAVIWFAMYAALKIGWEAEPDELRKSDWPVLLVALASAMVPVSYAARLGLLMCAAYAFATTRPGEPGRRVALLLAALTGTLIWGPLILSVFAAPVLALDAHIVGQAIGSPVDGNIVQFAHSRHAFLIAAGCSSIHNISLAIVLWCTAVALFELRVDGRMVALGIAMIGLMFGLNIARLCAIGLFPDQFEFIHRGFGAALFGWAGLIGIGILAALGTHDALSRRS
jgi:exosortase/archaeosortase family protein